MAKTPREEVSTYTVAAVTPAIFLLLCAPPVHSRKITLLVPPPPLPSPVQHHHHHHVVVLSPNGNPPSPQTMASLLDLPRHHQQRSHLFAGVDLPHLQFQSTSTVQGSQSHQYHFHVMPELQESSASPAELPESLPPASLPPASLPPASLPPADISGDPEAKNFALQQSRRLHELMQTLRASGFKVDLEKPIAQAHHESNDEEADIKHGEDIQGDIVSTKELVKALRKMKKETVNSVLGGDSWRRYVRRSGGRTDVEAGGDLDIPTSTNVNDELRDLLRETVKLNNGFDVRDGR